MHQVHATYLSWIIEKAKYIDQVYIFIKLEDYENQSAFGDKAMRSINLLTSTFLALLLATISFSAAYPGETYGVVNDVIDGTIFDINIEKADPRVMSNVERIKLADIESPDASTSEGAKARDFTFAVLMNKRVFLDIDNIYGRDEYGRLICVAYLSGSYSQPLIAPTFNRMIVDAGYAKIENLTNNEFEPNDWWSSQFGGSFDIPPWLEEYAHDFLGKQPEKIAYELPGKTKQAIDWLVAHSPPVNK